MSSNQPRLAAISASSVQAWPGTLGAERTWPDWVGRVTDALKRARPSAMQLLAAVALALLGIATTAQFLTLSALPATPANDLAMHAMMVEGLLEGFRSGQWLPRLLSAPGHIPDIPVFQYYGFMTGLIGLPGVLLGLSPFTALMAGLTVARVVGLGGVYLVARLLGGNRSVAVLAAAAYALTPYLISNLYGRVDVAESIAHCELPFLVLGVVVALNRSISAGAAIIAATIFLFALTHPIFLLYGTGCLALIVVVSATRRIFAAAAVGTLTGLLLSAFQWYPALITDHLLSGHFLKYSPFKTAIFTSISGFYGLPLSMADRGWVSPEAPFVYPTPGWLALPALIGLAVLLVRHRCPLKRRQTLMLLVPGALYLFLSYSPIDVFQFLPRVTWALQMPYRLLAFVALFSALALPLQLPRLRWPVCALLIAITAAQSTPLLMQPTYQTPLAVPAHTYASRDYLIGDHRGLTDRDGWLVHYAKQLYPGLPTRDDKPGQVPANTLTDAEGWLSADNTLPPFCADGATAVFRVKGLSAAPGTATRLWVAAADRPDQPLSEVRHLAQGEFSVILSVPAGAGPLRLVSTPLRTIQLTAVDGLPDRLFHRDADTAGQALYLKGQTRVTTAATALWIATPAAPDTPLTGQIEVGPGAFELMLPLPAQSGDYMLVTSRFEVPGRSNPETIDYRRLSLNLSAYQTLPVTAAGVLEGHMTIRSTEIDRLETGAYRRQLTVHPATWGTGSSTFARPVTVELPLAYSPFFELTQAGSPLATHPNEAGETVIATRTLAVPIEARFSLPFLAWLGIGAGLVLLAFLKPCCRLISEVRRPAAKPQTQETSTSPA